MNAAPASLLVRRVPAFVRLRHYHKAWLRGDVLAAITLATYLLPASGEIR